MLYRMSIRESYAGVAQLVEQGFRKAQAVGSTPSAGSLLRFTENKLRCPEKANRFLL